MYNADDDMELDRLSKEAAEKYEAPGNANWSLMLAELDIVLPIEKKKRKYFLFWWLFPLLIMGGFAIYLFQNSPKDQPTTVQTKNTAASINTNGVQKGESTKNIVKEEKVVTKVSKQNNLTEKLLVTENLITKTGDTKISTKNPVGSISENGKNVASNEKNETTLPSSILTIEKENNHDQAIKENSSFMITKDYQELKTEKELTNENKTTILSETSETVEKNTKTDSNFQVIKNKIPFLLVGKGWSVSLTAGVDKSTVKFKYGNEPGYNFGISTGYHFNKKWSLHTGAIYTQKNYKLAGEDFTPVKGSWISYYKIDYVEGYCNMWEVPLMFRYALKSNANSNFFLSSGLSSYFMTKEKYNYFYYSNGALVSREASYVSSDTHILSILHFSGGFENRISNQLSILIEPYAKLPLSGVGLGNIQLSSFGVNFSAQFRSQAKRK